MMTMMNDTERHEAARDVLAERRRQIEAEGWTPEHDDAYAEGDLAQAAGCYSLYAHCSENLDGSPADWPWPDEWWKPAGPRRNLVKAGALILAEIERLDRAALAASTGQGAVPQASAAQSAPAGERDAFEAWLSSLKFVSGQGQAHVEYCLHSDLSDKYTTEWVSDMYRGWQARAAWQRTQAAEVPVELLERILPVLDKAAFYKFGDPVTPDSKVANDLRTELLAILAQHQRILAAATRPADQVAEGVVVSRELLENCADYMMGSASARVRIWHDQCRALLASAEGVKDE